MIIFMIIFFFNIIFIIYHYQGVYPTSVSPWWRLHGQNKKNLQGTYIKYIYVYISSEVSLQHNNLTMIIYPRVNNITLYIISFDYKYIDIFFSGRQVCTMNQGFLTSTWRDAQTGRTNTLFFASFTLSLLSLSHTIFLSLSHTHTYTLSLQLSICLSVSLSLALAICLSLSLRD